MIYLLIFAIITILIILTHRQLGLSMLIAIAMANLAQLISADLASFLIRIGVNLTKEALVNWVIFLIVILPVTVVIARTHRHHRSIIRIVAETALLMLTLIGLIGLNLSQIIKMDVLSTDIFNFSQLNLKLILIIAGIYGLWQVIIKHED